MRGTKMDGYKAFDLSTAIENANEIYEIKLINSALKSKHFTIRCKFEITETDQISRGETEVNINENSAAGLQL
jgi:DNA uptake protein ComE-like DNA-binding protein